MAQRETFVNGTTGGKWIEKKMQFNVPPIVCPEALAATAAQIKTVRIIVARLLEELLNLGDKIEQLSARSVY